MEPDASTIKIADIAAHLQLRKQNNLAMPLLLGSRTGALFRSQKFYETLHSYAPDEFRDAKTPGEQFARCYRVLTRADFSPAMLYSLLVNATAALTVTEAELCLARLIMQGYFDPIITTNPDTLLEEALKQSGWREGSNFEVVNLVAETGEHLLGQGRTNTQTIIKVFGIMDRNYVMSRRRIHLHELNAPQRAEALKALLRNDCLLIGLDETWDAALYQVLLPIGGHCWFVAEEKPSEHSPLYVLQDTRKVHTLLNEQGAFAPFMLHLSALLAGLPATTPPPSSTFNPPPPAQTSFNPPPQTNIQEPTISPASEQTVVDIFISYHPRDEMYLKKLGNHLASMKREGLIKDWSDAEITGGQNTLAEVQNHLKTARIILLLLSDDYIASERIYYSEVQRAMYLHLTRTARVIPLLVRPVDWQGTIFKDLKPLPENGQFITQWNDIDSAFQSVALSLRKIIQE